MHQEKTSTTPTHHDVLEVEEQRMLVLILLDLGSIELQPIVSVVFTKPVHLNSVGKSKARRIAKTPMCDGLESFQDMFDDTNVQRAAESGNQI